MSLLSSGDFLPRDTKSVQTRSIINSICTGNDSKWAGDSKVGEYCHGSEDLRCDGLYLGRSEGK